MRWRILLKVYYKIDAYRRLSLSPCGKNIGAFSNLECNIANGILWETRNTRGRYSRPIPSWFFRRDPPDEYPRIKKIVWSVKGVLERKQRWLDRQLSFSGGKTKRFYLPGNFTMGISGRSARGSARAVDVATAVAVSGICDLSRWFPFPLLRPLAFHISESSSRSEESHHGAVAQKNPRGRRSLQRTVGPVLIGSKPLCDHVSPKAGEILRCKTIRSFTPPRIIRPKYRSVLQVDLQL